MSDARYITTDIYLTAFLCHRGVELLGIRRLGSKKVEFSLIADPWTHELLRLYWSDQIAAVIPRELFQSLREIKNASINRYEDPFIHPLPHQE